MFFGEIDVMKTNVSFSVECLQNPALDAAFYTHPVNDKSIKTQLNLLLLL